MEMQKSTIMVGKAVWNDQISKITARALPVRSINKQCQNNLRKPILKHKTDQSKERYVFRVVPYLGN
jgi:hypothetical protein